MCYKMNRQLWIPRLITTSCRWHTGNKLSNVKHNISDTLPLNAASPLRYLRFLKDFKKKQESVKNNKNPNPNHTVLIFKAHGLSLSTNIGKLLHFSTMVAK